MSILNVYYVHNLYVYKYKINLANSKSFEDIQIVKFA